MIWLVFGLGLLLGFACGGFCALVMYADPEAAAKAWDHGYAAGRRELRKTVATLDLKVPSLGRHADELYDAKQALVRAKKSEGRAKA